jgi:hypothetical protein
MLSDLPITYIMDWGPITVLVAGGKNIIEAPLTGNELA